MFNELCFWLLLLFLPAKVNNASATFINMIQVAHAKPIFILYSFHDFNFHNIFSSIYKALNHENNHYYIISKLIKINVLIINMTTTINIPPIPIIMPQQLFFYISHPLMSIEASL